jgi:hypothetical protein
VKYLSILLAGVLPFFSLGQANNAAKDYLGQAKPISFENAIYHLVWTSHPTEQYYKQEYLVKGESLEKFRKLVTVDVLVGDIDLKEVVSAKIAELKQLKESNPMINYQAFEKNGEIMLDFLLSQATPDGKQLSILERNVYRYKNITDQNGKKALLLFAVSERAYGADIDRFLAGLKSKRMDLLNAVGGFKIPPVTIAR